MREIKFRGWDGEEMHDVAYVTSKGIGALLNGGMIIPREDGPDQIMQFTGMKDKNGVEIYEGDIVKHWRQGNRVVVYPLSENYAGYGLVSRDGMRNTLNDGDKLYEVVGNIYQNPELLDNA